MVMWDQWNIDSRKLVSQEISNPDIFECELTDLFWWWWYEICIACYTKIGTGVTSNVTVQTDQECKFFF